MDGLESILKRYRDSGLFTHAYAAHGRLNEDLPFETSSLLPDGRDVFDLASITKALVTVPLVFRAARDLNLDLNGTVREWLAAAMPSRPDLAIDSERLDHRLLGLPVASLLRHESGLPGWWNFWITRLGVMTEIQIAERHRQIDHVTVVLNRAVQKLNPSKPQLYSDVGFILLGLIVERIWGLPIPDAFSELMTTEMGFDGITERLHFATRLPDRAVIAVPTSFCELRRRKLVGEVHDENSAALGGETGHAGLFGSGPSLAKFLVALNRSVLGRTLMSRNAASRVLPPGSPPNQPCLGWRQGADPSSIGFGGGRAMGHMGFTGVAFWVDPEKAEYAILLTNRVVSSRINVAIAAMRREIFSAMGSSTIP